MLTYNDLKHPFLSKDQFLYSIETCEPFENIPTVEVVSSACYIYLMHDTTNNFYKIGISNNPQYREKTLQSEKPTIELIATKEFPVRKIAESFEKALHQSFSNKRIRGEWFNLDILEVEQMKKSLE